MNVDAEANHGDFGATFMLASGNDGAVHQSPAAGTGTIDGTKSENLITTIGPVRGLRPIPQPGIGMQIVGGLLLLLWIQRFRRYGI